MIAAEIKETLSLKDRLLFAVMFAAFFALVGFLGRNRADVLFVVACVLTGAWTISLLFNRAMSMRVQMLGGMIPGVLVLSQVLHWADVDPQAGMIGFMIFAGVALLVLLAWSALGYQVYVAWTYAALPIGWTISHVILASVFYLLVTPIGLLMRLSGRDPMHRKIDPSAKTYWMERKNVTDPARYFRQF